MRGLKHSIGGAMGAADAVAPYVGAWIETREATMRLQQVGSRTLRGCVD